MGCVEKTCHPCNPGDVSLVDISLWGPELTHLLYSAISFGLSHTAVDLRDTFLGNTYVASEVWLSLIGFFNKIMDYLMEDTIEHIVQTRSTLRMVRPRVFGARSAGIKMLDLELKEELTKPWRTLSGGHKRRKAAHSRKHEGWTSGRRWWDLIPPAVLRLIASGWLWCGLISSVSLRLIVSACFLLTGIGLNTIAYPKLRWFPDGGAFTGYVPGLVTPKQILVDLDWSTNRETAIRVLGNNSNVLPVAETIAGTRIYDSFVTGCDWAALIEFDRYHSVDGFVAKIFSSNNSVVSATQSIDQAREVMDQLKSIGPEIARISQGMLGPVFTTSAHLTTSCSVSNETAPLAVFRKRNSASLEFSFPYNGLQGSLSVNCSLDFRQAILPIHLWTKEQEDSFSASWWFELNNKEPLNLLDVRNEDEALLDRLVDHLNVIISLLDRVTPELPFVNITSRIAESTIARRIARNKSAPTDVPHVMTPMVAYLVQQVLQTADWTTANASDGSTVRHLVRFWVYSSGPRLTPEYIALTPLFVMALVCVFDLALLCYQIMPAPWLRPQGLLCLANMSEKLSFIGDTDNEGAAAEANIFVKVVDDELRIVDKRPDDTELLQRRGVYRYQ